MKLVITLVLSLMLSFFASAQNSSDTLKQVPQEAVHSVRKATLFSAVLPGAGQVYNHLAMPKGKKKAFWKVPLIYAGLGLTGYLILHNNSLQKSLKSEYNLRKNSNFTQTFDPQWEQYDERGVTQLYEQHLNRRDLFILAFGVVYLLQVVDAAVEAQFVNFDISENLSLRISPTMLNNQNAGLRLSFNFK
jgi:hypothetical protein